MPKSAKEVAAIRQIDASALEAQERIVNAANKAQKLIDDATIAATAALEQASRVPDRRNINGSFNWDRGDRYRRGSDDRLERLEEQVDSMSKTCGDLEVGQAKREAQISELLRNVSDLNKDVPALRDRFELAHDALAKAFNDNITTVSKKFDENLGGITKKFDELSDKFEAFSAANKTWLIGVMITVIMAMLFIISSRFIP